MHNRFDTIIFDSIIGNSDRHQENWAFIREYIEIPISKENFKRFEKIEEINFLGKVKNFFTNKRKEEIEKKRKTRNTIRININNSSKFSPIYDSGCCLAREKTEEEILKMNNEIQLIHNYINRGKSEIHWDEKKISHFELVQHLLNNYNKTVTDRLIIVKGRFKLENLKLLINNIDHNLPDFCIDQKLSKERKEVIIKIVNLRIDKLLSLI